MDKIIAACQQTGAQAVHPGYGFSLLLGGFGPDSAAPLVRRSPNRPAPG